MNVQAKLYGVRLSAQKGRLVADLVRGQRVGQALNILAFTPKKGAKIIKKVLESAIANAEHNAGADIEDIKVREYLKKKLSHAAVGRVVIERPAKNARITIYSARPGVVIGKKGEDIEGLRNALQRLMGVPLNVNIEEIRKPDLNAQL